MLSEMTDAQRRDIERLRVLSDEMDVDVSEEQGVLLTSYLDLMLQKNQIMNLTAIRDFDKGIILHLVDSLLFCHFLSEERLDPMSYDLLDMGTGGGLPGIPLAIMRSQYTGILCDSTKKKAAAVGEFLGELGLDDRFSISDERLESLALEFPNEFSHVVVRAMGMLPILLEYATPLLSLQGTLVISKGNPTEEELGRGKKAANILGLDLVEKREFDLPEGEGHRTFLVYQRIRESRVKLPREIGYPTTYPLA